MTIVTATPVVATRGARTVSWVVRIPLALQFVVGGVLKLTADPRMVAMFADVGVGQELRLLVGACEVAGAIGLLVPWLARAAAIGLVLLMIGAAGTNVVALGTSPALPLVFGGLAAVVVVTASRKESGR